MASVIEAPIPPIEPSSVAKDADARRCLTMSQKNPMSCFSRARSNAAWRSCSKSMPTNLVVRWLRGAACPLEQQGGDHEQQADAGADACDHEVVGLGGV